MFVLWTDVDLRQMVAADYPELLQLYDSYPQNILRFDMARHLILYKYGGVYADIDFEALRAASFPVFSP